MRGCARARGGRGADAAPKWRFARVETATPCPPESLRASLPAPWSLSTLPASVRRSQRLLRSFWQTGDRDFRQPTSARSRPTKHLRAIARSPPIPILPHAGVRSYALRRRYDVWKKSRRTPPNATPPSSQIPGEGHEAPAGRPDWRVQAAADDAVLRFTPFQRLLPAA